MYNSNAPALRLGSGIAVVESRLISWASSLVGGFKSAKEDIRVAVYEMYAYQACDILARASLEERRKE